MPLHSPKQAPDARRRGVPRSWVIAADARRREAQRSERWTSNDSHTSLAER